MKITRKVGVGDLSHVRNTLELIIELEPEDIVTSEQVKCGIIEVWNAHGGRGQSGNFGRLDAANLARIYLT